MLIVAVSKTEFPPSAVLDWLRKIKHWLSIQVQQLLFKDHLASYPGNWTARYEAKDCQAAIIVYHLMCVPQSTTCSGQTLVCAQGFLHACTLVYVYQLAR